MNSPSPFSLGKLPCLAPRRPIAPASLPTSYSRPGDLFAAAPSASNCASGPAWCCCSPSSPRSPTSRPGAASNSIPTRCAPGGGAGTEAISPWRTGRGGGASPLFPPLDEALVKALACETVAQTQLPLSRQSLGDLASRACAALGRPISRRTVRRILDADAIKPWRYEYWIFPRDPQFAAKAGPILDLYAGFWEGQPLGPKDYVLSADEKTSIQARIRCHPSLEPAPGRPAR